MTIFPVPFRISSSKFMTRVPFGAASFAPLAGVSEVIDGEVPSVAKLIAADQSESTPAVVRKRKL